MAALSISVEPTSSLIDEQVKILLSGAEPTQKVTLQARLVGDKGEVFESHAHYIADEEGKVDVCVQCCLGGSYTGIESMGLLWSMKAAPGQRRGLRLMKTDVTKPFNITLNCFDGHLTSDLLHKSDKTSLHQPLSSVTFHKWYMADGVQRIPVREGRIRGTLFLPTGDGPFAGIIDLLGGTGGLVEYKAALLASRGFAALALAYTAYDDIPIYMEKEYLDLDYFVEVAEWLLQHPKVSSHGLGINSRCLGTWPALLLASYRSDIVKAVVAIAPWHAAYLKPYKYQGKLSRSYTKHPKAPIVDEGIILRNCMLEGLETSFPSSELPAVTPVENIACPVLLVYGTDDMNLNSDYTVDYIYQCMKKVGKEGLCSVLRCFNAGHLIEPPHTPLNYSIYNGYSAQNWVMGGETRAHAIAQEKVWANIFDFFLQNLPTKLKCYL